MIILLNLGIKMHRYNGSEDTPTRKEVEDAWLHIDGFKLTVQEREELLTGTFLMGHIY